MAVRQAPQTEPVLDNSALAADVDADKSRVVHALPKEAYSSLIHLCQTLPLESLAVILNTTKSKLAKLGVQRSSKAHRKLATGSKQFDPGSFVSWASGIQQDDADSINQLLGIDATAQARFSKDDTLRVIGRQSSQALI